MKTGKNSLNRRHFLGSIAAAGIGSPLLIQKSFAQEEKANTELPEGGLVDSFPLLQNPSPDSINVVWVVKSPSTGYVEWGTSPDLGNITQTATFGLNPYEERFLSTRITGLAPNTRYYYRTVTQGVHFDSAYKILVTDPQYSETYSFVTPGAQDETASFAVMNDTHESGETLDALTARLKELDVDYTVWNGDLVSDYAKEELPVRFIAQAGNKPFAAEKPLLFTRGNHDYRGVWVRHLPKLLTPWQYSNPAFYELGYNFAVRRGPLVLIGLDTGEDKPDRHPVFQNLVRCEPYRQLQAAWLADVLEQPEIKSAPFIVAFCHIPLFDSNPNANPGDILDAFASWQRPCSQLWGPLFEKHGVQLLVAAHMHQHRYDPADDKRSWAQVVGGGPNLKSNTTIMYGKATATELTFTAEKLVDHSILGTWKFKPRSV